MKLLFKIIVVIGLSFNSFVQEEIPEESSRVTSDVGCAEPYYLGEYEELGRYIGKNLVGLHSCNPPDSVQKVWIKFLVSSSGEITKVEFKRYTSDIDKEYLKYLERFFLEMKGWMPAKLNGAAIDYWVNLPISFGN